MRTGTILALLALVLLVAAFGLRVFGWLLAFGLLVVVLAFGALAAAFWAIKRRMRRNLERLARAMADERSGPEPPGAPARRDAIDVEPVRKPRDGADAPEEP